MLQVQGVLLLPVQWQGLLLQAQGLLRQVQWLVHLPAVLRQALSQMQ